VGWLLIFFFGKCKRVIISLYLNLFVICGLFACLYLNVGELIRYIRYYSWLLRVCIIDFD
jgi:hypothetical protein